MTPRRLRRRAIRWFQQLLGRDEPPWEVALSFAIGVGISFSPFLGFHTLIALLIAWIFPLNKVDTVLGTLVFVNPWTMVPIYTSAMALGWLLLGNSLADLPEIPWRELASFTYWRENGIEPWRPYLAAFAVGTSIYAISSGTITYLVLVRLIRRHRARRAERLARRQERRLARLRKKAAKRGIPAVVSVETEKDGDGTRPRDHDR